MENQNTPILKTLKTGASLKLYEVTGNAGMKMPLHYSTGEAVVIIQKGSALLHIDGQEHQLSKDDIYIIPADKMHSLQIETEFKSVLIMEQGSDIEFVKNN